MTKNGRNPEMQKNPTKRQNLKISDKCEKQGGAYAPDSMPCHAMPSDSGTAIG